MSKTLAEAQAALDAWDEAHKPTPIDPGMQSMRFHQSKSARDKSINAFVNQARRESKERARLKADLTRAKQQQHRASIPQTPVDPASVKGATHVLINTRGSRAHWEKVKRVNKKTVTCHTPYPGFDDPKYSYDRIVGVKH